MSTDRLNEQINFLIEIDKLKQVLRQNTLFDASRRENSAEHSWHLAMMAVVLAEHANEQLNIARVVELLLIHDMVEIYAGDTFCYDTNVTAAQKQAKENEAAERLFAQLPADQSERFLSLWHEFEARTTPEAKFANALDRLQPMLANFHTAGGTWRQFHVTADQVWRRAAPIADGSEALDQYVQRIINEAIDRGDIAP